MNKLQDKVIRFTTALMDVYRDEEKRQLPVFPKLEIGKDATEDVTAMLLALMAVFMRMTGYDGDLIDFTHVLNKLAVQHVMEGNIHDSPELLNQ